MGNCDDDASTEIVNNLLNGVILMVQKTQLKRLRKLMIGARIRVARKMAGLDQKTFSERIKSDQSSIARWESGAVEPGREWMEKISKATSMPVEFFYKD
jgi:DNA-binding transcriptional regulator YiaG